MKKKWIFILWVVCIGFKLQAQSTFPHKSEAEIIQMTPAQRVIEFCEDHVRHAHLGLGPTYPNEYSNYLQKALFNDGVKGIPQIIQIFNEFDPTKGRNGYNKEYRRLEGASFLLGDIDNLNFRVRSNLEGRNAIAALERSHARLEKVNQRKNGTENDKMSVHLRILSNILVDLKGFNRSDECVKDTLKVKYEINLTYYEQVEYINYLIAHHPKYPSSSEREHSKKGKRTCMYKEPELFQQAYLAYKATKKPAIPIIK